MSNGKLINLYLDLEVQLFVMVVMELW